MKLSFHINEGKELLSNFLFSDDSEIVRNAIESGADVNTRRNGYPPLYWAVVDADFERVKMLVENGADVNMLGYSKKSTYPDSIAYYLASKFDDEHFKIAQYLVSKGMDVNKEIEPNAMTPLMISAQNGNVRMTELLIKNGAEVNKKSSYGLTALQMTHYQKKRLEERGDTHSEQKFYEDLKKCIKLLKENRKR